jgi:hypothetical protein
MTTITHTIEYMKTSLKTSLFSVFGILFLGMVLGFATGFDNPKSAFGQVIVVTAPIAPPVVVPPIPVIIPPIIPAIVLPPCCTAPTSPSGGTNSTPPTNIPASTPNNTIVVTAPVAPPITVPPVPVIIPPVIPAIVLPPCCTVTATPDPTPVVPVPVIPPTIIIPPIAAPVVLPVPQCTLTANPTSIQVGTNTQLSWTTTNANSITVDQGVGSLTPVLGGTKVITPTVTTTYTGTVVGAGGTSNCTATVTVTTVPPSPQAPSCTLTANPTILPLGSNATLAWTVSNGTLLSINNGIGAVSVPQGTRVIAPVTTTTYTGTVTGANGSTATCTATVTVTPVVIVPPQPSCTLTANPTSVIVGGTSVLSWTTTNGTSLSIDNSIGAVGVNGGTKSVTLATTTTYTGTVTSANGSTNTCKATVTVTTTAPISSCTLSASPTSITTGACTTLSYSGTNITGGVIDNGAGIASSTAGTIIVCPTTSTTYTGTFTTPTGPVTCTVPVTVTTPGGSGGGGGGGGSSSGGGGGSHFSVSPTVTLNVLGNTTRSVSLSQIPYTGLDLGFFGTIVYWLMLILWSLAAAYLVLFALLPRLLKSTKTFTHSVQDAVHTTSAMNNSHYPSHSNQSAHSTYNAHALPVASVSAEPTHYAHVAPKAYAPVADMHAASKAPAHTSHQGFRSFGTDATLTIDDIVKGLSRESGMVFESEKPVSKNLISEAHTEVAPSVKLQSSEKSVTHEAIHAAVSAPQTHMSLSDDVSGFISSLLAGDRDAVFSTMRGITKSGGDTADFLSQAVCALDDAYRARVDGTHVHPDIARITSDLHTSFLERMVTSLATAVDSSYSAGITGTKLALTRALALVNG